MSPARRWIRDRMERFLERFYEGPAPPSRIATEIARFRAAFPNATRDECDAFAQRLAENAYRDGYVRGFEWVERDLESKPKDDPDVLAEQLRHDPPPNPVAERALLRGMQASAVPYAQDEAHFARLFHERGIQEGRSWGVVVVDDPDGTE